VRSDQACQEGPGDQRLDAAPAERRAEGRSIEGARVDADLDRAARPVPVADGDLRRPAVHKALGISVPLGLSDYLSEKCSVEQVIYNTRIQNFCVVAGGPIPNNPVELLNSQRMRSLMTSVCDRFDWVVLDSPPVAGLSDADILASMTDGVLVVVRALRTPADMLEKAMEALKGRNVLGIVFNGHEDDKAKSYSYYYCNPEPEKGR
jgi:capsular exopolysaccharide synthesis family protein